MPIHVVVEQEIRVGQEAIIEAAAPRGNFLVVFEDDGETGYFYAVDTSVGGQQIQDALHIYNAADVAGRKTSSLAKIGWSEDGTKAVLLIDDCPHAVFDFTTKQGCCRTGFPPVAPHSVWSSRGHSWNDGALQSFS